MRPHREHPYHAGPPGPRYGSGATANALRGELQSRIKRAFKRTEPEAQPVPVALVHGLRHTYATELASSGVSMYTVMNYSVTNP